MKNLILASVLTLITSGCVTDIRKGGAQIAYSNVNHPLSDTAVFSAIPESSNSLGQIVSVDGNPTSCWKFGCPSCIRVLAGDHTFKVRYSIFNNGTASYLQGEVDIKVSNMEPKHIYATRYRNVGNDFSVAIVDEGSDSDFQKNSALNGVNSTCGKIDFQ